MFLACWLVVCEHITTFCILPDYVQGQILKYIPSINYGTAYIWHTAHAVACMQYYKAKIAMVTGSSSR